MIIDIAGAELRSSALADPHGRDDNEIDTAAAAAAASTERQRNFDSGHEEEITGRLRRAAGQLHGVTTMYERGRWCIDVLDQLSAVRRAVDGVALLVLEDHVDGCVQRAILTRDAALATEMTAAVRRYVRSQ